MLKKNLQKYFNFSDFRAGQKEVVEAILEGHDVVALMPTGGGKSLCFQLPALLDNKLTIVVSPLIALMKDQVDGLVARGIPAAFINSSLTSEEIEERIFDVQQGKINLLYIAPERFASYEFIRMFENLEIFLFAVDEAHCVSQWGHDFRPDYLKIKEQIGKLKRRPVVAAFTATATPEVKDDIIEKLELKNPKVFVRGFDRPNLKFFAQADLKPRKRILEVLRMAKAIGGTGIVYTLTRKNTEEIAKYLRANGISSAAYHAGMKGEKREAIQNDFMENKFKVIVATIAFGMGVDKSDIRFVIHCGMPGSLEGYYQEAGRAGRDGAEAYCVLLHSKQDVSTHKYFLRLVKESMLEQGKDGREISSVLGVKYDRLDKMVGYVLGSGCRRQYILDYFGDPEREKHRDNCQGCDICLGWNKSGNLESANDNFAGDGIEKKPERESATVGETVSLYKKNHTVEQIAKIRNLGISTIFGHLTRWYLSGGELEIEKFVSSEEERQILSAIAKAENYQKLKSIKDNLPEAISYEKIRLVIAKIQKINLS
jgi:ATP-dependent DNA helicase RecQ